jgi:3-hydroxyisobutyrate dehydrogenase/2-hydroxy-3-oxopropionate reductase
MAKVAFLGLGVMGYPMAGHLAAKGHEVRVYNRTAAKAAAWSAQHGGATGATPAEAARDCDLVIAFAGMKPGAVFVDHTTVSALVSREMALAARERGLGYVDAPVSGGQAGAENGVLTVMCGGTEADYAAAEPVIAAYAKACRRMGDVGAGQLTKMCNQIAIAGVVQGLSEALHFAEKAGLPISDVVDAISQGAAGSWQMANRYKTMEAGTYDFGFAVDWMRKDLGICLSTANETGASLPLTALVDQFYKEVQGMGGGRWDTSSLIARLRR